MSATKVVTMYPAVAITDVLKVARDYPVIPCLSQPQTYKGVTRKVKAPRFKGWQQAATQDPAAVSGYWTESPNSLVGVPTGTKAGIIVVDIDPEGMAWYEENKHRLHTQINRTPRGLHLVFADSDFHMIRNDTGTKVHPGVDVRGDGGYVIWWPSHGYEIENEGKIAEVPDWLLELIKEPELTGDAEDALLAPGKTHHTIPQVIETVGQLDPDMGYKPWCNLGMGLHHQFDGSDLGLQIWNHLSAKGKKYPGPAAIEAKYKSFKKDNQRNPVTFATVVGMVNEANKKLEDEIPILNVQETLLRPRPDWLVKNLIETKGLAVIYGPTGTGKTFFSLDLAASIVEGTRWRDSITKPGKVVYVAAEDFPGVRNRIEGMEQAGRPLAGLFTIPIPVQISDGKSVDNLITRIRAVVETPSVIFLDTLAQVMLGIDENSSDMGLALAASNKLMAAFDCLVIFDAHPGKDESKGIRGWYGIQAAANTIIRTEERNGVFIATVDKQKNGQKGSVYSFTLVQTELGPDEDGIQITTCLVSHTDLGPGAKAVEEKGAKNLGVNQKITMKAIRDCGGESDWVKEKEVVTKAAQQLGGNNPRQQIKQALKLLVGRNIISRENGMVRVISV